MDREKVIKGLECCLGSNDCDIEPEEDCPYKGMCLCAMALRLDVLALLKEQEVKTGHWIDTTNTIGFPRCECSECNSEAGAIWMKYCPNCGAKMEGR